MPAASAAASTRRRSPPSSSALDAVPTEKTPFIDKPRDVRGHWVEPKLVAEVSFGEWTPDGRIRHSVFHGLRDDKDAEAIGREQAVAPPDAKPAKKRAATNEAAKRKTKAPANGSGDATVEGIRISHPDRVIDVSTGITKIEVVDYYLDVARLILPHLVKRPVSLVRAPAASRAARLPAPRRRAPHPRAARARPVVLDPTTSR